MPARFLRRPRPHGSVATLARHALVPLSAFRIRASSASEAHLPNCSLKADRCGVVCATITRSRPQRPLSSSVRPRKQLFSCVSRSSQHLVLRLARCSCSAFSLLLSLSCAGLRVALGSWQWRARKIMRSLLADWRAGAASHCRLASSNGWLGYVGNGQLCRFQRSRHFRTLGGPNYSLKSDRRG